MAEDISQQLKDVNNGQIKVNITYSHRNFTFKIDEPLSLSSVTMSSDNVPPTADIISPKDIEDLVVKETTTNNIITKTNLPFGDYAVNPYVGCIHACKYCYACFMKRFTGHTETWGRFLDAKTWPPITDPKKYNGTEMFVGSVTDPYNPLERKYERTKAFLTQMQGSNCQITLCTKSDLVLRDIPLLKTLHNPRVAISINTLDESFRADMDKAVTIQRRLAAMKRLHDEGIRTICFISPIFPGITDVPAIISAVKNQCNYIWLENLNLRGSFRTDIMQYIADKHPELKELYQTVYTGNNKTYWKKLSDDVEQFCRKENLDYVVNSDTIFRSATDPPIVINCFYHTEIKKIGQQRRKAKNSKLNNAQTIDSSDDESS